MICQKDNSDQKDIENGFPQPQVLVTQHCVQTALLWQLHRSHVSMKPQEPGLPLLELQHLPGSQASSSAGIRKGNNELQHAWARREAGFKLSRLEN